MAICHKDFESGNITWRSIRCLTIHDVPETFIRWYEKDAPQKWVKSEDDILNAYRMYLLMHKDEPNVWTGKLTTPSLEELKRILAERKTRK